MNLHTALTYSFNGRVPDRPILGASTNSSYAITDANVIHVPQGTLPANTTYLLSSSGAKTGDEITVSTLENAHFLAVSAGSTSVQLRAGIGQPSWCRFEMIGGIWRLIELSVPS
jgi:hypothetical protein